MNQWNRTHATCRKCGIIKPKEYFGIEKDFKEAICAQCKAQELFGV